MLRGRRAILPMHGHRKEMKTGTVTAIKEQFGVQWGKNPRLSREEPVEVRFTVDAPFPGATGDGMTIASLSRPDLVSAKLTATPAHGFAIRFLTLIATVSRTHSMPVE